MRIFARTSLGLLGLGLMAPMVASAQAPMGYAPAGYQPASAPATAPVGFDGRPVAAAPAPAAPAPAPHVHKGRTLCASCAAKQAANMPPGKIVGCEHSKNGVCTACQAVLNMPGTFVMGGQTPPAAAGAPGRAVASSSPAPASMAARSSRTVSPGTASAPYDGSIGDPMPVGVVQANFSPNAPMGAMPAAAMAPASAPGRAVAESGSTANHEPYQAKGSAFPRPHIIAHLLGLRGIGSERAEERANKKAEAHAMISYDANGTAPVEELPAKVVFGKNH